jgi:glycosyltransferase involved in cell wall biosynthesis
VKILLLAPSCDAYDVGEAWVGYQWASRLAIEHELTVLAFTMRGHTPASIQLPGVRVIEWDEPPVPPRLARMSSLMKPSYLSYYLKARHWIKQALARGEVFDVAHQPVPVAARYPSAAAGLGIPLILGPVGGSLESPPAFRSEEESTPWYQKLRRLDRLRLRHDPQLRRTYESAACVVGIAPYVMDILGDLDLRRTAMMSETGLERLPPETDRDGHTGPVKLLYVGRLVRTKGAREIVRALSLLPDLPVTLDLVGDGFDREACTALVQRLGQSGRVTMHGAVPRHEVDRFYERADVFVFPSYREAGGNVVFEAMGHGLPLIVCDRGGPGAAVDPTCAIALQAESPAQLAQACADAIRTLVEDPELRRRMGSAARVKVATTALWQHRVERMTEIYAEVVTSHR